MKKGKVYYGIPYRNWKSDGKGGADVASLNEFKNYLSNISLFECAMHVYSGNACCFMQNSEANLGRKAMIYLIRHGTDDDTLKNAFGR